VGNHTVTVLAYDSLGLTSGKTNAFSYLAATSLQNQVITENGNSLSIAPNPVSSNFVVKYNVKELSPIEFSIYNINGRIVDKLKYENIPSPSGEFNWTINNRLAPGVYYISMQQKDAKVAMCKLVKIY
jgi:hypothetical protein